LNTIVAGNADVSFGSYPVLDNPEYKIVITAESRKEEALNKAVGELLAVLPGRILVRTE
jgi:hypothetical protein